MLRQAVPLFEPQQLGLVCVELETISGHQQTDISDAALKKSSCRHSVVTTAVDCTTCWSKNAMKMTKKSFVSLQVPYVAFCCALMGLFHDYAAIV